MNKDHLTVVCMLDKGANQCRYLATQGNNYHCLKRTPYREIIDTQVDAFTASHQPPQNGAFPLGDNCQGLPLQE